jgi:pyruvate formate lyase activating enzyme
MGIWVEVTTLVVPAENDSNEELKGIASFLADSGKEIPWHISCFHPDYKMSDKEPTPLSKLKDAYQFGKDAGLRYVYIGNVLEQEKTYCHKCCRVLISRLGFDVIENNLRDGKCPDCNSALEGVAL